MKKTLLTTIALAAAAAGATDLELRKSVDISPQGEVRLAAEGEIFFRDSLADASRWGKPMDHDKSIRVTVGADCPEGGKCLEIAGTVTEARDNAWCIRSAKQPFEPKTERFMFRMQVTSPTIEAGSITPHGKNWGTAIEWFDEAGAPLEVTPLYYPIPLMGFATVRTGGKIPPKARSFLVRLGFDGPNVPGGEAVRMRDLALSYVSEKKTYDRYGEIVSYPCVAGGASVSWDCQAPKGTRVRFQYAGAETSAALHKTAFRGPDGTAATYYDRPFAVAEKFMRYRAVLESDGHATPVLTSVTVGARRYVDFLNRPDRIPPYVRLVNAPAPVEDVHFKPELEITDDSTVDWTAVTVKLDGEEATAQFRRAGDRLSYVGPERTWAPKLHKVQVVAKDWVGNVHTAEKRFYVGTRPDVPQMTLRDDGVVLVDGQPFFPIGIYGVKPCAANGQSWDGAMAGLKAAGFNLVQTYTSPRAKFLEAAAKAGLKAFSRPRMPEDWEFEPYRPRPEILAWYLGDDTSGHCTPMELRDRHDAMHAADGRRLTCQADGTSYVYRDYAAGTDVFIPEIYPIHAGDAQDVRDGIARVSASLRLARTSARKAGLTTRSVWALMQHFQGWTNWKRFPTRDELVCSSFSALANGANGIMWYTYSGGPSKFNKNVMNYGAIDDPKHWAELCEVVARVNEIKDVLLERTPADQPAVRITQGPKADILDNPSLITLLKRHAGQTYVIAVNGTPEALTAELRIPGVAPTGEVLWERRTVSAPDGVLSESFAPLAVHVYRFSSDKGADVK